LIFGYVRNVPIVKDVTLNPITAFLVLICFVAVAPAVNEDRVHEPVPAVLPAAA